MVDHPFQIDRIAKSVSGAFKEKSSHFVPSKLIVFELDLVVFCTESLSGYLQVYYLLT